MKHHEYRSEIKFGIHIVSILNFIFHHCVLRGEMNKTISHFAYVLNFFKLKLDPIYICFEFFKPT
jgi:hypothetical protein